MKVIFILNTMFYSTFISVSCLIIAISAKEAFYPGDCLKLGESLDSTNGCFKLVMQTDGNLVLYRKSDNKALWSSKTDLTNSYKFCHQTTGILLIKNHLDITTFIAGNSSTLRSAFAVLQDDGNFVLYTTSPTRSIWATNTFSNC